MADPLYNPVNYDALQKAARAALPALELLGDYIGNTFPGKVGYPPFDRCQIIAGLKTALGDVVFTKMEEDTNG